MDKDLDNIILGALALGFEEVAPDRYQCSKEQLLMLCAIVANETVKQMENEE